MVDPVATPRGAARAAAQAFEAHADTEIITGFPGLGPLSGARVLAAVGYTWAFSAMAHSDGARASQLHADGTELNSKDEIAYICINSASGLTS